MPRLVEFWRDYLYSSDSSGMYQGMREYLNSWKLLIFAFVNFENVYYYANYILKLTESAPMLE